MPEPIHDDAFAKYAQQHTLATATQVESAREFQADCARKGTPISLGDALVKLGIITLGQRDSIEQRLQTHQKGGIIQLLHYRLVKKLGEGGMGAVYLAEDTLLNRQVALKVLPRQHASDPNFMRRFQREADAMGRLNHVNIVRAFSVGEDLGRHFFVMEYCEGETLDKRIKKEGFIPHGEATEIAIQVARGLQYAHALGVIHRDIKPANIIMSGRIAKILDLGLSKTIEGTEQSFLTQSGVAMGTPHYISPEQARGEKDIDDRADIYSLGSTFYHLVTGDTPFHGSSAFEVVTKHLNAQVPDPRDIREEVPEGVVHILRKMMAKERRHRYRHCGELLKDLERVVDGMTPESKAIDAALSSVAMPRAVPSPRRPSHAPAHHAGPAGAAAPPSHAPATKSIRKAVSPLMAYLILAGTALAVMAPILLVLLDREPTEGPSKAKVAQAPRPLNPQSPDPPKGASITSLPRDPQPAPAPSNKTREDRARDILDKWKGTQESGLRSQDDLLQEITLFVSTYGDTQAGQEGRGILDKMRPVSKPPSSVQPAGEPATGSILREVWTGIPGSRVVDLTSINAMSRPPDSVNLLRSFEAPSDFGDDYGTRIRGFLHPPVDGKYLFWIASDDASELYLSASDTPAHKSLIAFSGCVYPLRWDASLIQKSDPISLIAGRRYYIEALHKEGGGGDYVCVAWQPPGGSQEVIPGKYLSPYPVEGLDRLKKPQDVKPADDTWVKSIQILSAEEQAERVLEKLQELNPGWDGKKVSARIDKGAVVSLTCETTAIRDISPIRALTKLENLNFEPWWQRKALDDVKPLEGLRLKGLNINGTRVRDLSPLKGMPLEYLACMGVPVNDLSPLAGMPLKSLTITTTEVEDLSPIRDLPLTELHLTASGKVKSIGPISGMKLTNLSLGGTQITSLDLLRDMPLTKLSLHPGLPITDLSPLRNMPLKELDLRGCRNITSLAPLAILKLAVLDLRGTAVSDVSVLKDMPLRELRIYDCKEIRDLTPLQGTNLEKLTFMPNNITKGLDVLRKMGSLKQLSDAYNKETGGPEYKPAAEFWANYGNMEIPPPEGMAHGLWGEFTRGCLGTLEEARKFKPTAQMPVMRLACERQNGALYFSTGVSSNFTGRFAGYFKAPAAGPYDFILTVEDSGAIEVTGKASANKWDQRKCDTITVRADLEAGLNPIQIFHRQLGGWWTLKLEVQGRNMPRHVCGQGELFHKATSLSFEVGQKNAEGWICIFNGRDLAGWTAVGTAPKFDDGAMILTAGQGAGRDVPSANFELKGNLFLRVSDTTGACGSIGIRQPGLQRADEPSLTFYRDGDVQAYVGAASPVKSSGGKVAFGTWQRFQLRVVDDTATFEVEGATMLRAKLKKLDAGPLILHAFGNNRAIAFKDLWLRDVKR